ncbi:hypothetical protein AYY17_08360 [Morganella psychrotolerans]|uniref:Aminoglycoside 6-adenylyltransferase n=2 Tax=Morganella psychrotolerans TaxID=368603 RepID=A0A1B8H753_9GAMM|nr:hypothetical protein AYY17_08360 [Morganella psychrotolerans]
MRSDDTISQAILCCAQSDDNIRAVILNGSRANKQVKKDKYQDFDLVFFVQDINAAKSVRSWEVHLGVPVLQQCPDDMLPENKDAPARAACPQRHSRCRQAAREDRRGAYISM